MIFFWSDTHFRHAGIVDYCHRPYASVEEMNEGLVEAWNRTVTARDTIYFLGDFGFGGLAAQSDIFDRLRGKKHLVVGNHDEANPAVLRLPWLSQSHIKIVRDEGRRVVCCHYPLESWPGAHRGYLHAHGHSHGSLKRVVPHRWDVGADVETRGPISIDMLFALAAQQAFSATDHHGDL